MIVANETIYNTIHAPVRTIRARVELYNGSTLLDIYPYNGALKSFSIERVGESSKFFGYGLCQRLNVKLIDKERAINITTENSFEISIGCGCEYIYPFPAFKVSEVRRDENTNELSITAYDALYSASEHTVAEIPTPGYTIHEFAGTCAAVLGLPYKIDAAALESFATYYPTGANFDGAETIREALDAIAEATQTIYFINGNWELTFKRLDVAGAPVLTIDQNVYFTLDNGNSRRISAICHATELGDNVEQSLAITGTTQYIRDNPFWELREDIAALVENALAVAGGLTINQFECAWRGNFLIEPGDKIELVAKDNSKIISYVLDDSMEYNGAFTQKTKWKYTDNDTNEPNNATTLGEALKQTYARVDKANKQITMVAEETIANTENISVLQISTDSISASVTGVQKSLEDSINGINENITMMQTSINALPDALKVSVMEEVQEAGVDKVVTSTGFTFDENGLTIEKSNSEITTQITENGMTIYKNDDAVLSANNGGVFATDLHANTYLIIGEYSRLENYEKDGQQRTACFWIGG